MRETNSTQEAASFLIEAGVQVVAVDGSHGSGKSRLASALGALMGLSVIHLDDFLNRKQGAYLPFLDYPRIASSVASEGACIIEGVCVLGVLDRISVKPDALVYVKRTYRNVWTEEDDLVSDLPVDEHLARIRVNLAPLAQRLGESGELGLSEEVIRYHLKYRPLKGASIVFLREDR